MGLQDMLKKTASFLNTLQTDAQKRGTQELRTRLRDMSDDELLRFYGRLDSEDWRYETVAQEVDRRGL